MLFWPSHSILPIGIEIAPQAVRLVQLRCRGGSMKPAAAGGGDAGCMGGQDLEIHARATRPITEAQGSTAGAADTPRRSAAVSAALRQALASTSFHGRTCITALDPAQIQSKSIRLPSMPDGELEKAAQWEARDRLGLDPADGRLVCLRAGEIRRGTGISEEVLLFAATGSALRDHIAEVSAAGLKIRAIDLPALALYRAASQARGLSSGGGMTGINPVGTTALVDVGLRSTQFLICQRQRLMFYKHIELGVEHLDQAVARKLGITLAEATPIRIDLGKPCSAESGGSDTSRSTNNLRQAVRDAIRLSLEELARELDMCLRYFVVSFRGTRPEQLIISGTVAADALIQDFLSTALSLPLRTLYPLELLGSPASCPGLDRAGQAEWALATGLALYEAQSPAAATEAPAGQMGEVAAVSGTEAA